MPICSLLRDVVNLFTSWMAAPSISKFLAGSSLTASMKEKKRMLHRHPWLRKCMEEHCIENDLIVVQIDMQNAFNLVSRQPSLMNVPELLPWVVWCYMDLTLFCGILWAKSLHSQECNKVTHWNLYSFPLSSTR